MSKSEKLEAKFWKALKSDMTMMLGLDGVDKSHLRPMTAQIEGDRGPIWFFTSAENSIVQNLNRGGSAIATFTSKGNDLFATVHGRLTLDSNPATIDKLWNSFVAAWYEGGKDDPKLRLLRLDAESAEVWLDGSSFVAGIKALLGGDPKRDYENNIAKVNLE
jgi:general stress protein 26